MSGTSTSDMLFLFKYVSFYQVLFCEVIGLDYLCSYLTLKLYKH